MEQLSLIDVLNGELTEANRVYHSGEPPIMSDSVYDTKEQQLRGLVKDHPEEAERATVLTSVGTDSKGRIAHSVPMLSLENYYSLERLCAWADSIQKKLGLAAWPAFTLEPKFDGVSQSIDYICGDLAQALKRGDGSFGESTLPQIKASKCIPAELPEPITVNIRAEGVVAQSTMNHLNAELESRGEEPYANTRNLAAGTLRLTDLTEVARRKLLLFPWDVLFPKSAPAPDSAFERLQSIAQWGFLPYSGRLVRSRDELAAAHEQMMEHLQDPSAEICKDGLVLKVDSHSLREQLGHGSKFPNWAVCFKPQNQKTTSTVTSIKWQVGKQGTITPVVVIAPVVLGGVTVERANLNNISWIKKLDIRIGSEVEVIRNGDVIPGVAAVLKNPPEAPEVVAPTHCPACASELTINSEGQSITHSCENVGCKGRITEMLAYVGGKTVLEIDGLGDKMAARLAWTGLVGDLAALIEFGNELRATIDAVGSSHAIANIEKHGFTRAQTIQLLDGIDSAKTAPWARWLPAFCIPDFGRRMGKTLAKVLQLQPEDLPTLPEKLASIQPGSIEGIGPVMLATLHRYAADPRFVRLCSRLHAAGVRPSAAAPATPSGPQTLVGVVFVITGEFREFGTRDAIKAKLEFRGAVSKDAVTKKVTHLLVGEDAGGKKLDQAVKLGIQQVGSDWLRTALGQ